MCLRIVCICVASVVSATNAVLAARAESFATSEQCIACHSGLHDARGDDISIGYDWRATMMANSARDPYWQASVRREVMDHGVARAAIEDKCATCHMPMARFDAATHGEQGSVFGNLQGNAPTHREAFDGVSCTVCHQIAGANLGTHASFDGGFEINPAQPVGGRAIFGPHDVDDGRASVMQSAVDFLPNQSAHIQQSELCATCHTLYTNALDERGESIGELPEQMPYQEWLHSEYRGVRSCQSCHMPEIAEETPIASVLGTPRPKLSQHTFRGGNAFMLGILNRYRGELGVTAMPQELDAAIRDTRHFLASATATVAIESVDRDGNTLDFTVRIDSAAGHKLPTGYPARRAWLHVRVLSPDGDPLFESGSPRADGSIAGNDSDDDPARFEPHHAQVTSADQVQIYESIMVDRAGRPTTGLLTAVGYGKDNRLLPRGFDKDSADAAIAVHGEAERDSDFIGGGDRVRYRVELPRSPDGAQIEVRLLFQPVGYRWAQNLRSYDAPETSRFVRYFDETAANSVSIIGIARATLGIP
jgi:hypothetical protein